VIFVPDGVPAFTCSTSVKFAVFAEPVARLAVVHVIVPVPPTAGFVPHVHPAGGVIDWKFVFGGVVWVKLTVVAVAGPLFVILCVKVTLLPAANELGEAAFVTIRSACVAVATTSDAVAVLFAGLASVTAELTLAVSLIAVPAAVPAFTFRTIEKLPDPAAKLGSVQLMVPVPFTAGVVQDHPAGGEIDWKVVFAGVTSVNAAFVAALGPLLVTIWV